MKLPALDRTDAVIKARAAGLDRVLDQELPRYGAAFRRLGE